LIGGGIGQIVYSLALGSYFGQDWRYMCRVSSGVGFVVILLGSLTMKRRSPIQSKKEIGNNIHLLVKDRNYRLFVLVCFVLQFGAFVPFVHLVTYMLMQGLTSGQAYNVMGLLSGASVIGRILFGTGSKRFGGLWMLRVALLICVLSLYLWLTCTTYESLLCFAFFFGLAYGGTLSLLTLICVEYWGNEKVGAALSVILLSMVPGAACSGIIAGAIRDKTGSYEGAIIAAGTFYLVAFLLSLIVTQPTKQSTVESVPEKEQEVEMI
jgi:predicted MFS family arabinose efflux permease